LEITWPVGKRKIKEEPPIVYLIGVKHSLQSDGPRDASESERKIFAEYLKQCVLKYEITFLGEEFNEESVSGHQAKHSTVALLAVDMKIEHRFCEPNSLERKKLGIPTPGELVGQLGITPKFNIGSHRVYASEDIEKIYREDQKYFSARERFWLEKSKNRLEKNILFVCGASHLDSFSRLLQNQNIPSIILDTKFHF